MKIVLYSFIPYSFNIPKLRNAISPSCFENVISSDLIMATESFLPLCDLLFNVISLAEYFCNVIFDLVLVYALYSRGFNL